MPQPAWLRGFVVSGQDGSRIETRAHGVGNELRTIFIAIFFIQLLVRTDEYALCWI